MDWYRGTVREVRPAATGCFHFALEVPPEVARGFKVPGQFVRLRPPEIPDGFFAMAQAPDGDRFEFLVKRGTPLASVLEALAPGETLEVSAPEGKGFPLHLARGRDLVLVATGTGLAPMRSVMGAVAADRAAYGRVHLLFGAFTPSHFPWPDEHARWKAAGIEVRCITSDPSPGWTGELGFVQKLVATVPLADSVAFLVGQREMVAEVRGLLTSRGLAADHVHLNF